MWYQCPYNTGTSILAWCRPQTRRLHVEAGAHVSGYRLRKVVLGQRAGMRGLGAPLRMPKQGAVGATNSSELGGCHMTRRVVGHMVCLQRRRWCGHSWCCGGHLAALTGQLAAGSSLVFGSGSLQVPLVMTDQVADRATPSVVWQHIPS